RSDHPQEVIGVPMRSSFGTVLFSVFAAACGGGSDATKPVEAPPPPSLTPAPSASDTGSAAPGGGASLPKPSMQEMEKTLVGSVADAINAHDAAKVAANYAEDATLTVAGMPEAIKGRDAIQADAKKEFDAFPNTKFAFSRVWGKNDVLVSEWVVNATQS